jgi:hypothetical protein
MIILGTPVGFRFHERLALTSGVFSSCFSRYQSSIPPTTTESGE